jgi:hypothetical protein
VLFCITYLRPTFLSPTHPHRLISPNVTLLLLRAPFTFSLLALIDEP